MPAGDGLGDDASRGSPASAADQYSSSASVMVSQRPPPVSSLLVGGVELCSSLSLLPLFCHCFFWPTGLQAVFLLWC